MSRVHAPRAGLRPVPDMSSKVRRGGIQPSQRSSAEPENAPLASQIEMALLKLRPPHPRVADDSAGV
jgi:hypothetical protein